MTRIACPRCSAVLTLKDASLLGKPGKCPKCGHRFVLSAAHGKARSTNATPSTSTAKSTSGAKSTRSVPSAVAGDASQTTETPRRPKVVRHVDGNAGRAADSAAPTRLPDTKAAAGADPPDDSKAAAATSTANAADSAPGGFPDILAGDPERGGTARLRELARKRSQQRRRGLMMLGAIGLCVGGAVWAGMVFLPAPANRPEAQADGPPRRNAEYLSEKERLETIASLIRDDSPTSGEPITLANLPPGSSIIVHLRPAELWAKGSTGEEVRYCLGKSFSQWLDGAIERYCLLPPAEIDEATIGIALGARGSEPQVSAVVRPREPKKTSELIQLFEGEPQSFNGIDVFVGTERAAVIGKERDDQKRPRLFATAPAIDAELLAISTAQPGITSDALMQLLPETDRQRDVSILFQPSDLETHQRALFGAEFESLVDAFRGYFDKSIEAAAWSIDFNGQGLYSELALRNDAGTTPTVVLKTVDSRLDSLGSELVDFVSGLNPAEMGQRKLVGRLPAMVALVSAATVGGIDNRLALLQIKLPDRAAPNLALASLLTWHESQRQTVPDQSPGSMEEKPQKTLAERLKTPIEIDFRQTPLEGAFNYIGDETGVAFEIDGDGLKLSGYTRNMPQTFALGKVPAEEAIAKILTTPNQEDLTVVLDAKRDVAIVTTGDSAKKQGLVPTTFPTE